jgi:DNA repair exonuclease SbcCD ATPase subunit
MNFSFYILGTPNGYNQYPADSNSEQFQSFAQDNNTESQLTVSRKGQLVYYAYMRKLQEKSNHFLGFCTVFNGVYCQNPQKLFQLFDRAFDDVLMKGELLKFERGKCIYTIEKFAEKPIEIERIKTFFKNYFESDFNRDFVALPTSFRVGNGKKANPISVKESTSEILAAIAEYDTVHIANNEKSLSELERTHKMLTELYAEKQELDAKHKKLLGQKKQYKVVVFLCLIVIVATIIFFSTLNQRDETIRNLNSDVEQRDSKISRLNNNVAELEVKNNTLESEKSRLQSYLYDMTNERDNLQNENSVLSDNVEYWKNQAAKRPYQFYVKKVDTDKSFKIIQYYDNGSSKESNWFYEGRNYTW